MIILPVQNLCVDHLKIRALVDPVARGTAFQCFFRPQGMGFLTSLAVFSGDGWLDITTQQIQGQAMAGVGISCGFLYGISCGFLYGIWNGFGFDSESISLGFHRISWVSYDAKKLMIRILLGYTMGHKGGGCLNPTRLMIIWVDTTHYELGMVEEWYTK